MTLTPGTKAIHKLTGKAVLILEVGPKTRKAFVPQKGWIDDRYLEDGTVRVRLDDMRIIDMHDFELEGIDVDPTRDGKFLLMEKN